MCIRDRAVTGRASAGAARKLALSDSCGFPLLPSPLAVKAADYPLTLPIYLLTPRRRLPLMAREFLEFLALPVAQATIAKAGYIDPVSYTHLDVYKRQDIKQQKIIPSWDAPR